MHGVDGGPADGEVLERGQLLDGASADTVAGLPRKEGFGPQANAKAVEGAQRPDRDARFRYPDEQARDRRNSGDPVISMDGKEKELIGDYKNAAPEWQPAGQPVRGRTHDFPGRAEKPIPYGIHDTTANTGWVSIGIDHDTAAFAVALIRRWWQASRTGLTVRAGLDSGEYPTDIRISDDEIAALPITRHRFHGDWNRHSPPPAPDGRGDHREHTGRGPDGPTDSPHAAFVPGPGTDRDAPRQLNELIDVSTPATEVRREQVLRLREDVARFLDPDKTKIKPPC
ncbi:hypothetical protein ASE09_15215 [Streptomyces sp. Root66D1]|nr:hypothetical protein ASD33_20260 [Streptomyces sp. Root1304]KRA82440.1 hypothetical protein ASE09_15215 [Streptomyces sp. Root66D1]